MTEEKRLRLFVAVELPDEWKHALAREATALDQAAPGFGRWVDPSLMHLTLVFLGGQDPALLPTIRNAVDAAATATRPFSLSLDQTGTFGSRRAIRAVWVGVRDEPPESLGILRQALVRGLLTATVPFEAEIGPFRAHLTLGRTRREATAEMSLRMSASVGDRQAQRARPWPASFPCEGITLVKSDVRPTGPIYTPLHRAALLGGR